MEMEDDDYDDERERVRVWRINVFHKTGIRSSDRDNTPSCTIEEEDETGETSTRGHEVGEFKIVRVPPYGETGTSEVRHYDKGMATQLEGQYERVEENNNAEFVRTLHEAYEAATEQQEQDRQEMAALEEVILMLTNNNTEDMKNAIENIYSHNGEGRSMAGALARFFQQQLQALLSKHELRVQELQANLCSWMKRCEELQSKEPENKDESAMESKRAFVEKLHKQLGAKNAKLQKLNNVVHQLERKIASLTRANALEGRLASGYEQTKQQSKQLVDHITSLKQQKQQLQAEIARCRELKSVNSSQMKEMEEELQRERDRIQKLTKELAKFRKKEQLPPRGDSSSSSSSSKESCKAKLESHIKHLNKKLFELEQQVKAMNKKKEVRDEVTDIEAAFLENLVSSDSNSSKSSSAGKSSSEMSQGVAVQMVETGKRAEECERFLKDIQALESRVQNFEQDLKESEMKRRLSEQTVLDLNEEIRRLKSPAAEECSRVARLVANLEELEAENRDLRRVIAVDKEEQIIKLEKELKKLKGYGKKPGSSVADSTASEPVGDDADVEELEQIIAEKDRLILELRFQHDQAKKKMSEVQTRFDILFKEWIEENSQKVPGNKPILGALPRPGTRTDSTGDDVKKESELQLLVYTMKRVVDKLRKENAKLRQAGLSESRYQKLLKRNRELKNTIDTLNFKIVSYGKASPHMQLPVLEKKVEDLTTDVQTLTDVNAELIHVLRQAEEIYPDLKDKLRCKSGAPFKGVTTNFQYFADPSRYNGVLAKQTREIARLQEELDKTLQLNSDLIYQIAKREDELDLVHGKLYVRDLIGTEGVRKNVNSARDPRQLKSHATTVINNGCFEVMPGDYVYNKTKPGSKEIQTLDAQLVDEIEELRLKHQNLTEVCKHYEQLLFKYTQQLHVPFKPLTTVQ